MTRMSVFAEIAHGEDHSDQAGEDAPTLVSKRAVLTSLTSPGLLSMAALWQQGSNFKCVGHGPLPSLKSDSCAAGELG